MNFTAVALLRELHEREKQLARKLASPGTPQRDLHDRIEAFLADQQPAIVPGTPDHEMDAAMVDAGMMSTADFVKAHGEPKTAEPPRDAVRVAAERVYDAVRDLNDAIEAAATTGVFCDFETVDVSSFAGRTNKFVASCSLRL